GQQTRQQRAVHLHHVGQVKVEGLVKGSLDTGMAAAEGIDTETREHVEISAALGVEEVRPRTAHVELVKANRLQHARQLEIQVLLVERVILAVACAQQFSDIQSHRSPHYLRRRP